jgi:hypothetical protein
MMDNFVTNFKMGLKKSLVLVVMMITISVSMNAQYMGRDKALSTLENKSTYVSQAISTLPSASLDYRYGLVQLFTYKAIYSEIQSSTNLSTKDAVNAVFARIDGRLDSMGEHHATMAEYNRKYKVIGFDLYQSIKNEIKELLRG